MNATQSDDAERVEVDDIGPVNLGWLFRTLIQMQRDGKSQIDRAQWLHEQFRNQREPDGQSHLKGF